MVSLDCYRPLSRRLDRCDRLIQNESRYPFGGNMYYGTMQITFLTRKFLNGERNLHCDVVHITPKWVPSLTLDCNGVFAIKAYRVHGQRNPHRERGLAGMGKGFFAQFCCCVPLCPCELRYSSSKDISFHRFPEDKVAGRECIFKSRRDMPLL